MVKYPPPVPLLITLYHSFRRGLAYQQGNKGRKPASTHSPACLEKLCCCCFPAYFNRQNFVLW